MLGNVNFVMALNSRAVEEMERSQKKVTKIKIKIIQYVA